MDPIYPITLTHLATVRSVVIGGGAVGERKIAGLLAANAQVRLISPEATPQLQEWAAEGRLEWLRRPYQPGDLVGASLAFAATDRREVNAQVAQEAKERGLLCNVTDAPSEGNFHVPAVLRRAEVVIAVSTAGHSPTRAQQVRNEIKALLCLE
jgi:cobalt-precorrin 5A hydrolase/precorrin-3B C17-methyltransferase